MNSDKRSSVFIGRFLIGFKLKKGLKLDCHLEVKKHINFTNF